jgi:membrane protease YdiL (CAAX protease family)
MLSANLLTASGVIILGLWFVGGFFVYSALTRQINARRSTVTIEVAAGFGLPESILATFFIVWFLMLSAAAAMRPEMSQNELSGKGLVLSLVVTVGLVGLIGGLLKLRGRNVEELAGLTRMSVFRAVGTGAILLFFAYPLISVGDLLMQQFLHGSSRQSIVELFNSSQTIQQRVIIIVFAVSIAPACEEFIFRFFIYGVLKRHFGFLFALLANALLFAAVHGHLPSLAALFVLGSCFTIAYEWSGSILVSMTMHSLFNALTLVFLAFPDTFRQ